MIESLNEKKPFTTKEINLHSRDTTLGCPYNTTVNAAKLSGFQHRGG